MAPADSDRVPAAASSMASGMPSRRRQMAATAPALASVSCQPPTASACQANSSAAAQADTSAAVAASRAGTVSGGTCSSCSPRRDSGARLVHSTDSPGQRVTSRLTSGAAGSRCSKLSSSTSIRRPPT